MSDKLEANTFGLDGDDFDELLQDDSDDIDDLLQQQEANHYSELVARQWDTPEGEWWP